MPRIPNTSPQTLGLFVALLESRIVWRHGYDLSQECDLKSGTLYPLLMRLAEQGLLESRWDMDGDNRRPRHVYRLSAQGARYARTQIRDASALSKKPRLSTAGT